MTRRYRKSLIRACLPTRYGGSVVRALLTIWSAAGYPWSLLRLKALLPALVPWARRRFSLAASTEWDLLAISSGQMDRLLSEALSVAGPATATRSSGGSGDRTAVGSAASVMTPAPDRRMQAVGRDTVRCGPGFRCVSAPYSD